MEAQDLEQKAQMEDMEQYAMFEEKVMLNPVDLRNDIISFDDILLSKLKTKLEGKCSKNGYVIPGSLTILSRSMGYAERGRFTADFIYYIKAQGKVYFPPDGYQLEGKVIRNNKMGLYVIVKNALKIMIPRDLHIGDTEFDKVRLDDTIKIEIKKTRFQVNDTHVVCIGQFLGRVGVVETGEEEEEEEEEAPAAAPQEEEEEEESSAGEEDASEEEQEEE